MQKQYVDLGGTIPQQQYFGNGVQGRIVDNSYRNGVIQETAENGFIRGVDALKGLSRTAGRAILPISAGLTIEDVINGRQGAREYFSTQQPTYGQEVSAGLGGLVNGLSFGLVPQKVAANVIQDTGNYWQNYFNRN